MICLNHLYSAFCAKKREINLSCSSAILFSSPCSFLLYPVSVAAPIEVRERDKTEKSLNTKGAEDTDCCAWTAVRGIYVAYVSAGPKTYCNSASLTIFFT